MARYGKAAGRSVKSALHREKRGTLRSGKGGRGGKVTSRKQAIAIGLSEARKRAPKSRGKSPPLDRLLSIKKSGETPDFPRGVSHDFISSSARRLTSASVF